MVKKNDAIAKIWIYNIILSQKNIVFLKVKYYNILPCSICFNVLLQLAIK